MPQTHDNSVVHQGIRDCNQTELMKETTAKACLRVSVFEKTEYTNLYTKDPTWVMQTK